MSRGKICRCLTVLAVLGFMISLFSIRSLAQEEPGYVYAFSIEGGSLLMSAPDDASGSAPLSEVKRMELIEPGTILMVTKGARALVTCPYCRSVEISEANSPFMVNLADFSVQQSKAGLLVKEFAAALKHFVYPDSKEGLRVSMQVRGGPGQGSPVNLWPPNNARLLMLGKSVRFAWDDPSSISKFKIKDLDSGALVFETASAADGMEVEAKRLQGGKRYVWSISRGSDGGEDFAILMTAPQSEAEQIRTKLSALESLLPKTATADQIVGLKAGFLKSMGYGVDALYLLQAGQE